MYILYVCSRVSALRLTAVSDMGPLAVTVIGARPTCRRRDWDVWSPEARYGLSMPSGLDDKPNPHVLLALRLPRRNLIRKIWCVCVCVCVCVCSWGWWVGRMWVCVCVCMCGGYHCVCVRPTLIITNTHFSDIHTFIIKRVHVTVIVERGRSPTVKTWADCKSKKRT